MILYFFINGYTSIPLEVFMILKAAPSLILSNDTNNSMLSSALFVVSISNAVMEIDDYLVYDSVYFFIAAAASFLAYGLFYNYFSQHIAPETENKKTLACLVGVLLLAMVPILTGLSRHRHMTTMILFVILFGGWLLALTYQAYLFGMDTNCWYGWYGALFFDMSTAWNGLDKYGNGYKTDYCKIIALPTHFIASFLMARCTPGNTRNRHHT